jgi:hypothetical protein
MSTAAPAPTQMTAEQGYNLLHGRVYAPVFFNKLAQHGNKPKNEAEATAMLNAAGKLRTLYDADLEKKAAAKSNKLTKLSAALDQRLAAMGLAEPAVLPEGEIPAHINKYAADAAKNPEFASAVLALLAGQNQAAV